MANIPTTELIVDTLQYLRCLSPHLRERKAALLLTELVAEAERLHNRVTELETQLWPPDGRLSYAEIRERLLEAEKNRATDDAFVAAARFQAHHRDAKAEIERLELFLRERVIDLKTFSKSGGGYHLRRIALEADRLLKDPMYFPGCKAAEAADKQP